MRTSTHPVTLGFAIMVCLFATIGQIEAAVITPFQVFTDCKVAKEFRDKELPKKLDAEFERYRRGVQTRVDDAAKDFENSFNKSKLDLKNSSAAQRKEVSIAAGKFFASLLLKQYADKMKGPWKDSYDKLPEGHKKAVDVIAAKTAGLGDLTLDAARGKQVELSDALKPYADGAVEALSWALGPLSKAIVEAAKGGSETGLAYLEYKPDVDFAKQQVEFWRKKIDDLIKNSPGARVRAINAAKAAIDGTCGQ